jgi:hypothetical protein
MDEWLKSVVGAWYVKGASEARALAEEYKILAEQFQSGSFDDLSLEDIAEGFKNTAEAWDYIATQLEEK